MTEKTETWQYELSIVFPYYNEGKRIELHRERLKTLDFDFPCEILYVNDGSTDGTFEGFKASQKNEDNSFLENPQNLGKGGAVRNGATHARGKYILYTDFDIPVEKKAFVEILELMKKEGRGATIGVRLKDSEVENAENKIRKVLSWGFQSFMKWVIGIDLTDTQCGFKIFDHDSAKKIFPPLKTTGFAFDVEVLLRAKELGLPIKEYPVQILEDCGPSSLNIFIDPIKMMIEIFKIKWRLTFGGLK